MKECIDKISETALAVMLKSAGDKGVVHRK